MTATSELRTDRQQWRRVPVAALRPVLHRMTLAPTSDARTRVSPGLEAEGAPNDWSIVWLK